MRLIVVLLAVLAWSTGAQAATEWAQWIDGTLVPPRVNGSLAGAAVTFGGTGPILSAQSGAAGEVNFWASNAASYASGAITAPTTADLVRIVGPGLYAITFARPVVDPVLAVLSLGGTVPTAWDFGAQPFTILKTGPGYFGTGAPLTKAGGVLSGQESNGVIQFQGTLSTITFAQAVGETWAGLTVGVQPSAVVTPPAGLEKLNAGLTWDYAAANELEIVGGAFKLYEGAGSVCDQPDNLVLSVADDIGPEARTYARMGVPVRTGTLCYELTAVNADGAESVHSVRAMIQAETLAPAQPTGLLISVEPR